MLGLIRMDLGGYYVPSISRNRYFLIFVDDYSRYIWAWLLPLKDKKSTSQALAEFKAYAENQFGCKIQRA